MAVRPPVRDRLGEHWLDPPRDTPPVEEIHQAIVEELGGEETPPF